MAHCGPDRQKAGPQMCCNGVACPRLQGFHDSILSSIGMYQEDMGVEEVVLEAP